VPKKASYGVFITKHRKPFVYAGSMEILNYFQKNAESCDASNPFVYAGIAFVKIKAPVFMRVSAH
jgi:hypothetical protein